MKTYKILLLACSSVILFSCGSNNNVNKSPEEIHNDCMNNGENKIIYKDKLTDYCDCVSSKIENIDSTENITNKEVEAIEQECATEYTTLETNF